jgi:hypothetical protein
MKRGLILFNVAVGTPNSTDRGYHETGQNDHVGFAESASRQNKWHCFQHQIEIENALFLR